MPASWDGPIALLLVIVAVDAWVFLDAQDRHSHGNPVVVTVGPLTLSEPIAWLIACLVLWVVAVPLYLVARRHRTSA